MHVLCQIFLMESLKKFDACSKIHSFTYTDTVVGTVTWKGNKEKLPLHKVVTVLDEAFAQ